MILTGPVYIDPFTPAVIKNPAGGGQSPYVAAIIANNSPLLVTTYIGTQQATIHSYTALSVDLTTAGGGYQGGPLTFTPLPNQLTAGAGSITVEWFNGFEPIPPTPNVGSGQAGVFVPNLLAIFNGLPNNNAVLADGRSAPYVLGQLLVTNANNPAAAEPKLVLGPNHTGATILELPLSGNAPTAATPPAAVIAATGTGASATLLGALGSFGYSLNKFTFSNTAAAAASGTLTVTVDTVTTALPFTVPAGGSTTLDLGALLTDVNTNVLWNAPATISVAGTYSIPGAQSNAAELATFYFDFRGLTLPQGLGLWLVGVGSGVLAGPNIQLQYS
jgi:hypothetical protein